MPPRRRHIASALALLVGAAGCASSSLAGQVSIGEVSAPDHVEGFDAISVMRFPDRERGVTIMYTPPTTPEPMMTLNVSPIPPEAIGPDGPDLGRAMEALLDGWSSSPLSRGGLTTTGPDPMIIEGVDGDTHRGLAARIRVAETRVDIRYYLFLREDLLARIEVSDDGLTPRMTDERALALVAGVLDGLVIEGGR